MLQKTVKEKESLDQNYKLLYAFVSNHFFLYTNAMNVPTSPTETELTPQNTPVPAKKSKLKSVIKEIVIFIAIAVGIVLPFRIYVAEPYLVDGRSMDPTFTTGDYLIVNKISYRTGEPERNSVLVFKYPGNPKKSFIKRVIGLPGETVIGKSNALKIINAESPEGFLLDQSYVTHMADTSFEVTLEGDEYFVLGDNRLESYDSRSWGPLKKEFILGVPIIRLLPVSKIEVNPGELSGK